MAKPPKIRSIALLGAILLAPLGSIGWLAGKELAPSDVVQAVVPKPGGERVSAQMSRSAAGLPPLVGRLPRAPLESRAEDIFPAQTWVPPPAAVPAPAPVAPPLPYSYVGKFVMGGTTVVLLARQEANFVVRSGETLEGAYHIDSITPDLMTLTYLPLNQRQTLRIGVEN
jgi:hypothetical protein